MVLSWIVIFSKVMYALVVVGSVWQALSLLRSHYSPLGARSNFSKNSKQSEIASRLKQRRLFLYESRLYLGSLLLYLTGFVLWNIGMYH